VRRVGRDAASQHLAEVRQHVAGAAALVRQWNPSLSPDRIAATLEALVLEGEA